MTVYLYETNIVRVTTLPPMVYKTPKETSMIVIYEPNDVTYQKSTPSPNIISIKTTDIIINADTNTGYVTFMDPTSNEILLQESNKTFIPIIDVPSNNNTYALTQEWILNNKTTGVYGFGEYQNGYLNYKGATIKCVPFNTEACVPLLVTNAYYGIYWDNVGVSTLNSKNIPVPATVSLYYRFNIKIRIHIYLHNRAVSMEVDGLTILLILQAIIMMDIVIFSYILQIGIHLVHQHRVSFIMNF